MTYTMKYTGKQEWGVALYELYADDQFVGQWGSRKVHSYVKDHMKEHDTFVEEFRNFAPDTYTYTEFMSL